MPKAAFAPGEARSVPCIRKPAQATAIVPYRLLDAVAMSDAVVVPNLGLRALTAGGAVLAAVGVALSAYAAHVALGEGRAPLQMAALFAFGHGIALAALAPRATSPPVRIALVAMLFGVLLFSGSLTAAHFLGAPTTLAPYGGGLMILAWLVFAADALRR